MLGDDDDDDGGGGEDHHHADQCGIALSYHQQARAMMI